MQYPDGSRREHFFEQNPEKMKYDTLPLSHRSAALEYVLRIARYARNSDDATRRVAFEAPTLLASDWPMAIEAARLLNAETMLQEPFDRDDAFAVHFLAGFARMCGRSDAVVPLTQLADLMWTILDARAGSAIAA